MDRRAMWRRVGVVLLSSCLMFGSLVGCESTVQPEPHGPPQEASRIPEPAPDARQATEPPPEPIPERRQGPHGLKPPTSDLSDGIFGQCFKDEKLPGRELTQKECECVVATDERAHSPGTDQANARTPSPDPRQKNPEYARWTALIKTTHCACCHNSAYKGPGSPYWDLAFQPVWWDSVSDQRLRIMSDYRDKPGQTLPLPPEQLAQFKAFIEGEIARREKLRKP